MYQVLDLTTHKISHAFDPETIKKTKRTVIMGTEIPSKIEFKYTVDDLFWFTYRHFEEPLTQDELTSYQDTSKVDLPDWGCSIRCAQMLFANAYWRINNNLSKRAVISLFLDKSCFPYSLHNICKMGHKSYSTNINEYWSPLSALVTLKDLYMSRLLKKLEPTMNFKLAHNNTIDGRDFISQAKNFPPTIFYLVGMYGDESVTPSNYYCLQECLRMKNSLGMIAGIQNRALYVVGFQDENLLVLDPHTVNDVRKIHPGSVCRF